MSDVCKLLTKFIEDEKQANIEYAELEKSVNKDDRWKIRQIKSDEKTHKEELTVMARRYKCKV